MANSPTSVTLSYLSYCPTYTLPSKTTRTTKTEGTSMPLRVGGMPSGEGRVKSLGPLSADRAP
jgi:hypothetical protein